MTRQELDKYIQQNISEQGTMSASALSELIKELIGYVPYILCFSSGTSIVGAGTSSSYAITSSQEEINAAASAIIRAEFEPAKIPIIYAYDISKNVIYGFSKIDTVSRICSSFMRYRDKDRRIDRFIEYSLRLYYNESNPFKWEEIIDFSKIS